MADLRRHRFLVVPDQHLLKNKQVKQKAAQSMEVRAAVPSYIFAILGSVSVWEASTVTNAYFGCHWCQNEKNGDQAEEFNL